MKPVEWLRGLGAFRPRPWGDDCPRGTSVPLPGPCPDCDAVSLTDLREGESARVSCLQHPEHPAAIRLASAGVLPGAELQLVQRWPAFVFRLGYAELAVDRETAAHIRVRREGVESGV
jgi:DtxR family Mn-dependent transcriptional regulator